MTTGRINQIAIALRTSFDGFLNRQKNNQKRHSPSAQRGTTTWVDEDHKSIHTPSPIGVFFAFTGSFDFVLCT